MWSRSLKSGMNELYITNLPHIPDTYGEHVKGLHPSQQYDQADDADPQCWLHHTIQTTLHIPDTWWMCQRSAPIPAAWSGRWCQPTMLTTSYNTNQATHTWHLWWTCQGCPGPAPIPAAWSGRWCRRSRRTAASPRCPCSSAGESWGTGSNNKLCQNRFHLPLHSPLPSPTSLPDHFSMDLHSVFNLDWAELDWSQWVHPLVKVFLKLQRTEEGLKHKWHFVSDISGTEPAFTGACWGVLLPPHPPPPDIPVYHMQTLQTSCFSNTAYQRRGPGWLHSFVWLQLQWTK